MRAGVNVSAVKMLKKIVSCIILAVLVSGISAVAQAKRPVLIRDTDKAEGKEEPEVDKPKDYNPLLAAKSLKIGDFYYKRKNYEGAIERYLEALDYQPNLVVARENLERACTKAVQDYQEYIRKHPEAPDLSEKRERAAKLEKKLAELKNSGKQK
jgi:tetratricopeptide (TPR) repeat protein